jgi:hypothetical protein
LALNTIEAELMKRDGAEVYVNLTSIPACEPSRENQSLGRTEKFLSKSDSIYGAGAR